VSTIKFGAVLNEASPLSLVPNYPELLTLSQYCEQIGFDSAWVMDHLTWGPSDAVFECWTTLTALLCDTDTIRVGPFFLCNSYRNPALVAKMAATLDIISNSRFILGMGAGWKEDEYQAYGYPFPSPPTRIAQLEESLSIMKLLWTGQPISFQGQYYHLTNAVCRPRPLRPDGPELWVGGGGEKYTLKVTAKHAHACNFSGRSTSLATFEQKLAILCKHCNDVGRNYKEILKTVTLELVLGTSTNEAKRRALTGPPSLTPDTQFVGTPSQCITFLQQYINAGASYFMLHLEDLESSLELFERDVMPSF
jgi:alkanesulfonate monooxygenase SsuD/methylene tetrahydromethanopterin reductase-like flavin-dependent oxidoreductase (luciferase family)